MGTVQDVIETIGENRRRFEDFCFSLSDEELLRPVPGSTWVVRDFAAHLATLDPMMLRTFQGAASESGMDQELRSFDVDAFNEAQVLERRCWPLDQVFAEARSNREKLNRGLEQLSDDRVDRATFHFPPDAKRAAADMPLKLFLAGWAQHDPIHIADMLKALPERADDPPTRAWLDNPFVGGYQRVMNR